MDKRNKKLEIYNVRVVNSDRKYLDEKLGDLCFGVVVAVIAAIVIDAIVNGLGNIMMLAGSASAAFALTILGISFYKKGGIR